MNSNILGRSSVSTLNGRDAPYGPFWCNIKHFRASQAFFVSEAKYFSEKKTDFWDTAAIKQQRQFFRILGGVDLVATEGMGVRRYDDNGGGGG